MTLRASPSRRNWRAVLRGSPFLRAEPVCVRQTRPRWRTGKKGADGAAPSRRNWRAVLCGSPFLRAEPACVRQARARCCAGKMGADGASPSRRNWRADLRGSPFLRADPACVRQTRPRYCAGKKWRRRSVALQVASGLPQGKVILTKFLARCGDPEFCLGMRNLGGAAGFAAMERFRGFGGGFKACSAVGGLALVHPVS